MSRSVFWDWEIRFDNIVDGLDALAYWEFFFLDCPLPVKYVPTGATGPGAVSVLLYANRAKARRLAEYLDAYFGQSGSLARAA